MAEQFRIYNNDAVCGLAAGGQLVFIRLHRHPLEQHFERGREMMRDAVNANGGPVGVLVSVPTIERTLPPAGVLHNFAALTREFRTDIACACVVVGVQWGNLGALVRGTVSLHLMLLRRKEIDIFDSAIEGIPWTIKHTRQSAASPLDAPTAVDMWRALEPEHDHVIAEAARPAAAP